MNPDAKKAHRIKIANAPCSWGALEFEGMQGKGIPWSQMLDELRDTGYVGTELGDWGFMPTDPAVLRTALRGRNVSMVGAFVPVALKNRSAHAAGEAEALKIARLLAAVSDQPPERGPFLVLADQNGTEPVRTANAGRATPDMALSDDQWKIFVEGAERVAASVRRDTGLRTAFHHHCAGYVETPAEIARFLELTDPELIGLVFDTGHYAYGTGTTGAGVVTEGLARFWNRVWHVHFKDCQPAVASEARRAGWDYFQAVQHGVFSELGCGDVDFPAAVKWLGTSEYQGWIVVEQDVLPGMGSPRESALRNRNYLRSLGV